jgi:hypothetical protein
MPASRQSTFRAGLELAPLHFGMCGLAWIKRMGWSAIWARHAQPLIESAIYASASALMSERCMSRFADRIDPAFKYIAAGFCSRATATAVCANPGERSPDSQARRSEVDARGAMPCMGMLEVKPTSSHKCRGWRS